MFKRNIIIVIISVVLFFMIYGVIHSFKENKETFSLNYKDNVIIVSIEKNLENIIYFSCKNKAKRMYKTQIELYKIIDIEKSKSERKLNEAIKTRDSLIKQLNN